MRLKFILLSLVILVTNNNSNAILLNSCDEVQKAILLNLKQQGEYWDKMWAPELKTDDKEKLTKHFKEVILKELSSLIVLKNDLRCYDKLY